MGEYAYKQQIILKVGAATKEIGAVQYGIKASQYSIVLTSFANFSVRAFRQIKISPIAIL